jgi:hypothetical protein
MLHAVRQSTKQLVQANYLLLKIFLLGLSFEKDGFWKKMQLLFNFVNQRRISPKHSHVRAKSCIPSRSGTGSLLLLSNGTKTRAGHEMRMKVIKFVSSRCFQSWMTTLPLPRG